MKAAKIAVVIVIIASLILWCRQSFDFGHIARSLPFSGGHRPGIYDVGTVAVLLIMLWGFSRLNSRGRRTDETVDFEDDDSEEDLYDVYELDDDDDDGA